MIKMTALYFSIVLQFFGMPNCEQFSEKSILQTTVQIEELYNFSIIQLLQPFQPLMMSRLKKCPSSPNCVCTIDAEVDKKKMDALSYSGSLADAKTALKELVAAMKNTQLQAEEADYLHFTFKTSLGGFIDDVEFEFDDANKKINFRSASRVGYSDMGANKRRMKKVGKAWAKR